MKNANKHILKKQQIGLEFVVDVVLLKRPASAQPNDLDKRLGSGDTEHGLVCRLTHLLFCQRAAWRVVHAGRVVECRGP